MAKRRVVRQGESLPQIAQEHGLAPETIWSAPENEELAAARRNYNVLAPGDELVIPDKRAKFVDAAVDKRHRFRRKGVPARLRLQLYDGEKPRAHLAYEIVCGSVTLAGKTDGDGVLEHWVPPGVRSLILRVSGEADVTILVGHLDPIDSGWSTSAPSRSGGRAPRR